jgi:hypothetical protein
MSQKAFAVNLAGKSFQEVRIASERFRKGLKFIREEKNGIHPLEPTKPLVPSDGFKVA